MTMLQLKYVRNGELARYLAYTRSVHMCVRRYPSIRGRNGVCNVRGGMPSESTRLSTSDVTQIRLGLKSWKNGCFTNLHYAETPGLRVVINQVLFVFFC